MKNWKTIIVVIFLTNFLFPQSFNDSIDISQPAHVDANDNEIVLSDEPTAKELAELFCRTAAGEIDPFESLRKVIDWGDKAVNGLAEFLYSESNCLNIAVTDSEYTNWESPSERKSQTTFIHGKKKPNKVYAILALDGIASNLAEQIIIDAALNHPEKNIRGYALKILAQNFYYRISETDKIPNKEILHILINNADDTSFVEGLGRIGEIAREGIKNWTGQDYGELSENKVVDKTGNDINMQDYRELKWQEKSNVIVWNKERKQFEMN